MSQFKHNFSKEEELNLCLSLGGIYSNTDSVAGEPETGRFLSLLRSCSVPMETNEEGRRVPPAPENVPAPMSTDLAAWAAASAAKSVALGRAIDRIKTRNCLTKESQGFLTDARDSPIFKSRVEQNQPKMMRRVNDVKVLKNWTDVMNRMPSVTTTGDGPNGKTIEGFLCKFTEGRVSIVCVCHGSFLTPAEFVRHAGRMDVENPMRHISVCYAPHFIGR